MPLRSRWFTEVSQETKRRLNACLALDAAHIKYGDVGDHVNLIQTAISLLTGAAIPKEELDYRGLGQGIGYYGTKTVAAVIAYKAGKKPPILNTALKQRKPDGIVGRRTLQSLDDDMAGAAPVEPDDPTPPVPEPKPTEERLISKSTQSTQLYKMSGGRGGANPTDLGPGGQSLLDFLQDLAEGAGTGAAGQARVAEHPLEVGDPDFGTETGRVQRTVDARHVLKSMTVDVVILDVKREFFKVLIDGMGEVRTTRNYIYSYGSGNRTQDVTVTRTVTLKDEGEIRTKPSATTTFFARQPSNYKNP